MGRLVAVALVVAAAGIAVIAVNGPGRDKPAEREARAPERSAPKVASLGGVPARDAGAPVRAVVRMRALAFAPARVRVPVGTRVRFVNHDTVAHTVMQDVGPRSGLSPVVDTPRIPPGGHADFVPERHGTIRYVCTLHPGVMHGRIVVTAARA